VGDGKLIIINMTVSSINDLIRPKFLLSRPKIIAKLKPAYDDCRLPDPLFVLDDAVAS